MGWLFFQDAKAEEDYRYRKLRQSHDLHLCHRAAGLLKWTVLALTLASPTALSAALLSLLAVLLACRQAPSR